MNDRDKFKQIQLEIPVPTEEDWVRYEEYLKQLEKKDDSDKESYYIEIQM